MPQLVLDRLIDFCVRNFELNHLTHCSPRQKLENTERNSEHTSEDDKRIPPRFGLDLHCLGVQLRNGGSDLIVLRRVVHL
jgi:hypothetical protein